MPPVTLTVKNYRCFTDQDPLRFELREGFTAFVGPNNAGKSTALKFFYEMRELFQHLANAQAYSNIAARGGFGCNYAGVQDLLEVFSTANDRPMSIDLDIPTTKRVVSRISLSAHRSGPTSWQGSVFAGPQHVPVTRGSNSSGMVDPNGIEVSPPVDALRLLSDLGGRSLYVAAFRNAINQGAGSYFDLQVGDAFINMWHSWKTGDNRASNEASIALTNDLARIFGYDHLEINATAQGRDLQVVVEGRSRRLRELGSGLAQFVIVLANVAIRRPRFLFIDEPELNLHPSLQIDFLTTLASYCPGGVLFASHSLGLARSTAERIYCFERFEGASRVREIERVPRLPEFLGEMSFSAFRELGHDRLLLVEGVTDVKVMHQFLRLLGKEHTTVVLPLGGDAMINPERQLELSELARISKNVSILIDSERRSNGERLSERREAFLDEARKLGFRALALERRALENYFPDSAVTSSLGASFSGLGPFDRLGDAPNAWRKSESWRIARQMTKDDLTASDLGRFLGEI